MFAPSSPSSFLEVTTPDSLVVASGRPLPPVAAVEVLVPSHQLTHLDALATALADERITMQQDQSQLRDEIERLRDENAQADAGLKRLMGETAQYGLDAKVMQDEIVRLRAERDRLAASLVASEQALAQADAKPSPEA